MNEKLFQLLEKAKQNETLRQMLLDTRNAKDPVLAFCELATEQGFAITVGELLQKEQKKTPYLIIFL